MKSYNNDSTEGYFLEFDVQYPESLSNLDNDLPFQSKKIKTEKV